MFANKMTTAANAIVLQYTSPVYVILISYFLYKKRPTKLEVGTIFATLSGISLFFIESIGGGGLLGNLFALLSGLSYGCWFITSKLPDTEPMVANFFGCFLNILLIPFIFFDANFSFDPKMFAFAAFLGVFQLGLGGVFFSAGLRYSTAISATIIGMIEPILNPLWVFLAIGEFPGMLAVLGAVIVILSISIYNILSIRQAQSAGPVLPELDPHVHASDQTDNQPDK